MACNYIKFEEKIEYLKELNLSQKYAAIDQDEDLYILYEDIKDAVINGENLDVHIAQIKLNTYQQEYVNLELEKLEADKHYRPIIFGMVDLELESNTYIELYKSALEQLIEKNARLTMCIADYERGERHGISSNNQYNRVHRKQKPIIKP